MSSRFFVGNIGSGATERGVRDFFVARGLHVTRVSIVVDRATGHSRGFGFVEFDGDADADAAMDALEGTTMEGRMLTFRHVDERSASTAYRRGIH